MRNNLFEIIHPYHNVFLGVERDLFTFNAIFSLAFPNSLSLGPEFSPDIRSLEVDLLLNKRCIYCIEQVLHEYSVDILSAHAKQRSYFKINLWNPQWVYDGI